MAEEVHNALKFVKNGKATVADESCQKSSKI